MSAPPTSASPALVADNVVKRYGAAVALDHVSVAIARGECLALVGESGSGKTTLLRSFNRMVEPDEGEVRVNDRSVRETDPIGLRRSMGYVPQNGGLIPHWRVRRNVELVPRLEGGSDASELAVRALSLVGLDPAVLGERWPHELSGGQRQRVAFARALASSPEFVLLDEPFGALDAITRADLQSMFLALRQRLRVTAVLVTHDLHEAITLADRVAVLRRGRIEQVAVPPELLSAPATDYVRDLLARARVTVA